MTTVAKAAFARFDFKGCCPACSHRSSPNHFIIGSKEIIGQLSRRNPLPFTCFAACFTIVGYTRTAATRGIGESSCGKWGYWKSEISFPCLPLASSVVRSTMVTASFSAWAFQVF